MRIKSIIYMLVAFSIISCNNNILCKSIDVPTDREELRLFLLKGYAAAKSVLEDVRIEYQTKSFQDHVLFREFFDPVFIKELEEKKIKIPEGSSTHIRVEEYLQKNDNEIWVFLYFGDEAPTQDVSFHTELIRTKDSPRFRVFDEQCVLEYYPTKNDGITSIGRAILEQSKTGLFDDSGTTDYGPVKFFGYHPDVMPDDVLSSPQLKIETKPQEIDGLLTYKINAPLVINRGNYDVVYWLSPDRSCLPVKTELHHPGRGLQKSLEVKEFSKLDDGRWTIKSILQRNYVTKKGETELLEIGNDLYTIRKLELHPQIDDDIMFSTLTDDLPKGVHIIDNRYVNEPEPPNLMGKPLPDFNDIKLEYSKELGQEKLLLFCFFDFEQRPSRNCVQQLIAKAKELKEKDIDVIAVQVSKIKQAELNEWVKGNDIAFAIGMIETDEEKTRFNWGVKSLPWLILTDKQHIVQAEGFNINELDKKIKTLTKK